MHRRIREVGGFLLSSRPEPSLWAVIAFWAIMTYFFWSSAKREEHRRRERGQKHTGRDTALLCLSGLILAALLLGGMFLRNL